MKIETLAVIALGSILFSTLSTGCTEEKAPTAPIDEDAKPYESILIPAGHFLQGSKLYSVLTSSGRVQYSRFVPTIRSVDLAAYSIDKYEVTNVSYEEFCQKTGRKPAPYADDPKFNAAQSPVVGVSWFDARDYCTWLGMRLPTGSEWEKAARGVDGRAYPWGDEFYCRADLETELSALNNFPCLCSIWERWWVPYDCQMGEPRVNFGHHLFRREVSDGWGQVDQDKKEVTEQEDGYEYTAPVGSYLTGNSPYGVVDMAGNVMEWTSTLYESGLESSTDASSKRILKGGAWGSDPSSLKTFDAIGREPTFRSAGVGFRCASSP